MPGPAVVCFDPEVARVLVEGGLPVLLLGSDGEAVGAAARSLRHMGRVSVMIGDPAAAPDVAAAVDMARELFGTGPGIGPGPDPVLVQSVDQARQITGRAQDIASPMG